MNKIEVLIEGYAKVNPDGTWKASSTTTLVRNNLGQIIIVDPGCNREMLLEKLAEVNLGVEDVDYVFITHHHLDHAMGVGWFPDAKVIDADSVQDGDLGSTPDENFFGEGIKIIKTPGHEAAHASLLVDTDKGKICISGDVFWWGEGKDQDISLDYHDEFASDMEAIKESRKKVLAASDYIVPGHGKMFKVER